ncbi:PD-(D/E)XK nuclease family protein [Sorangium sp. So ce131]|uniref:PD-(D/E)XK nuclease family protein n=1 Tax=Sorangium sp. So ce131 TaxID=3133282 RepID=UPI003F610674
MSRPSLLIVPTERHVERELAAAGAREARAADQEVRSRWSFVSEALALLAPDVAIASPQATRLATRLALDALPPGRLRQPAEPAARVALAHALDRAVGSFRRAGTTPAELRALGAPYASAVAEVLERADAALRAARLVDPRCAGFLLARALRAAGSSGALPLPRRVTIRGAVAWEPDDLAWVEALHAAVRASGGAGVTVELPALQGDDAAPVAELLERRWASLGDPPEITWVPDAGAEPLAAISAKTPEGEARAAAAEVAAALGRGIPPERIAVVVPALDDAALEPLRAALADAGIRSSEPRGRSAASCPDGRVALAILRLAVGPVRREQAIEILRAPGVHAGAWMDRTAAAEAEKRSADLAHRLRDVPVEVDRTGRLLIDGLISVVAARRRDRRAGPARAARTASSPRAAPLGAELELDLEAPHPAGDAHGDDDEAWMPHALERLLASARWIGEATTRPEIVRRFLSLLDKLGFGEPGAQELRAALRAERRGAGGIALEAMGQGARAARAIREQAEALARAARDLGCEERPAAVAEVYAELERAAAEQGAGARGDAGRAGAVRVDVAAGFAALEHDVAVVTGLDARAYGGSPGADETLLGEALRARLPAPSRPASGRERQAAQRAELGWALAGARSVALCFTRGDESEPNEPHPRFAAAVAAGVRERAEPASRVAADATALGPRDAELIALASGARPGPDIAEQVRVERARADFFLDPRAPIDRHTGRVLLDQDPALVAQLTAAIGGARPDRPIAVTHIERAVGCAFAAFARRVLHVRRADDLAESADARERGTLIHRALQAAFEALRELGPDRDPAEQLAAARAAAEEALGVAAPMAPLRREAIEKAIADVMEVVARAAFGDDAASPELRFFLAERRFGAGEPAPWQPLELPPSDDDEEGAVGAPSLWVDGQIDRIDRSTDQRVVRVVDYKTGKLPDAKERRRALQLPLYSAIAARALGAEEVRAVYVGVRQRGLVELWPRTAEEQRALAEGWAEAARAARAAVVALWQGRATPRPALPTLCARCDARDVCRRPAVVPADEAAEEGA